MISEIIEKNDRAIDAMSKLKVNDFFCGCGGMGISFQQAGFEIAGAWDFDKHAIQSYRENVRGGATR